MKKTLLAIFVILAVLGTGWVGGFYFAKLRAPAIPPEDLDFSLFWEAWQKLEENHIDGENLDHEQMIYGAVRGMTESLKDPHTFYMEPEELKSFEQGVEGKFEGLGVEIGIREEQLTVIAPLEGTPAERAGLRPGDKIIKIEDRDTRGMPIDVAVTLLRGEKGTKVILTVTREGWKESREFTITRDVIKVPSVRWELLEEDVAYVKIHRFVPATVSDFSTEAAKILASPGQKIILDLRNNPGGYMWAMQNIAGWFLERDSVVAIEGIGSERRGKSYNSMGSPKMLHYPIVVLVNQGSASASEILAGALRDHRGVKLIGETTFGKGSIQELMNLKEGGMKITVAKWLTPAGYPIDEIGLEPDIIVKLTEEDIEADKDPQLDKALEILKDII